MGKFLRLTGVALLLATNSSAIADGTVKIGDPDYSGKFPTLSRLCLLAEHDNGMVNFGTAVLSLTEFVTMNLKCYYGTQGGRETVDFDLVPTRTKIIGNSIHRRELFGYATLIESDLVFDSPGTGTIVEHLIPDPDKDVGEDFQNSLVELSDFLAPGRAELSSATH